MFYDLIIHPSRVEFVHRIFSPEKNDFTEKKLGSTDLKFKFDSSLIEKGDHYEAFKKVIKDLVDPYQSELNSINIIVRSSFFQMKSIICDQSRADYLEYINWEAYRLTTDQPDNYKFGYVFLEHDHKLILTLVRKSVYDYFGGIVHDIYKTKRVDFKLGCPYPLANYKEIIIYADKQLLQPFKPDTSKMIQQDTSDSIPMTTKAIRSPAFLLVLFFLFLITVAVSLFYIFPDFTRDKLQQLAGIVPVSEQVQKPVKTASNAVIPSQTASDSLNLNDSTASASATIKPDTSAVADKTPAAVVDKKPAAVPVAPKTETAKINKTENKPAEEIPAVKVDPALDPHPKFWDYIISVSAAAADSIVYMNGVNKGELFFYSSNPAGIKKAQDDSRKYSYAASVSGNILSAADNSFFFMNSRKRSNYNRFLEVKAQLGIKSRLEFPNIFRLNSLEELHKFIKGFKDNNVGFKKFVIEKTDQIVTFTVYFG